MGSLCVIVLDVLLDEVVQMLITEADEMVEAFMLD